ncbi:MAG: hypothetical protein LBV33_06700, partial [Lachnospiraceae bacterium]|nr:hypothetical protein [Lachnospiraceae bacterium]
MDSFVDKIAQRLNGQDTIRANAEAEAAEMKRVKEHAEELTQQLSEYELAMQEMRTLCLKNTENAQDIRELVDEARTIQSRIQTDAVGAGTKLERLIDEGIERISSIQSQDNGREELLSNLSEARRLLMDYKNDFENLDRIVTEHNIKIEEIQRMAREQKGVSEDLLRVFAEGKNDTTEISNIISALKNDV